MTTHYDVLGVESRATIEEIRRAYYRRARRHHPDAHAGSSPSVVAEAVRSMSELNAAWHVLRDQRRRAAYDQSLRKAKPSGHQSPGPTRRPPSPDRPRRATKTPALAIGSGFHQWMGAAGVGVPDQNGRPRLSLVVEGTSDLRPLRSLAPNGLFALRAAGVPLDDAELRNLQGLTGLQQLDLSSTRVSDAGLVHLLGIDGLQSLSLWNTAVTDEGAAILAGLPSLRVLGLGNTRVSDHGIRHVARLTELRVLQLWGTAVTSAALDQLVALRHLEILSLPWRVRARQRRRIKQQLPGVHLA